MITSKQLKPFLFAFIVIACSDFLCTEDITKLDVNLFKCNSEFCSNIACDEVKYCSKGQIKEKRSYCGCCDACVKYSDGGEPCGEEAREEGGPLLECQQGFLCFEGMCVEDESTDSCHLARKFRIEQKLKNNYPYAKDLWLPECNEDGSYKAKQQKKRKNICVDENGERIHGQEEQDLSKKSACGCSRFMKNLERVNPEEFMTKSQEHCTLTGDYDDVQCIGNICYCADNTTGEIIGRVAKIAQIHLLPCYSDKNANHHYLKPCEMQLIRSRVLRYQFLQKNINIVGLEFVSCDYDGTFAFKQCDSSRCVCTDQNGIGIKSYHPDKTREIELLMKCNCARDEHSREAFHSRYPRMNCDVKGNFQHLQCFSEDYCYCVDEDGDVISEQRTNLTENYCKLMLRNLISETLDTTEEPSTTIETTDDDYYY